MLVADVVYGAMTVAGTWRTGTWVDAGWLLFYALPAHRRAAPVAGGAASAPRPPGRR